AAFVDIDVGPDALDQLPLVDDYTGAFGQEDENIERAAADMKRRALLLQEPGLWEQPKGPKRNGRVFVMLWHAPSPPPRESKGITFWSTRTKRTVNCPKAAWLADLRRSLG